MIKTFYSLTIFTIIFIGFFVYLSFVTKNYYLQKNNKKKLSLVEFLNNDSKVTFKKVLIGMSFGFVFGFIDNAAIWLSINPIKDYIKGSLFLTAGWANTYSDFLGATAGTSIAVILKTFFPITNVPIWVDTFGVLVGCIAGMYLPMFFN
jgi:hypothetical protein